MAIEEILQLDAPHSAGALSRSRRIASSMTELTDRFRRLALARSFVRRGLSTEMVTAILGAGGAVTTPPGDPAPLASER